MGKMFHIIIYKNTYILSSITFIVLILSEVLVIGCVRLARHLLEDVEASEPGEIDDIAIYRHVPDYVGWLVQCPLSLKKTTLGLFYIYWCPLGTFIPFKDKIS